MKSKVLIMVCLSILIPLPALANPFLVCDPQSGVEYYNVQEDSVITKVTAQTDGAIKYDLGGYTDGQHSLTVAACNVWGCSEYVPFGFTKDVPTTPANSKIMGE